MLKTKLNLGCGRDLREGYVNMDISNKVGADVVQSMERGLPFEDNTFIEVLAYNSLTQISTPRVFVFVMNEIHRILKSTGKLIVRVPLATHECAFQDVFDTIRFTDQSFTYMEHGHRRYDQYGKHYGYKPFHVKLIENNGRQMIFELTPVK